MGLDGDFKTNKFGQILDLIPICNNVYKLHSICSECKNGKKALFTHRKTQELEQKVIGVDTYQPLCRACYYKKQQTKTLKLLLPDDISPVNNNNTNYIISPPKAPRGLKSYNQELFEHSSN